jgi:hypothetical protein
VVVGAILVVGVVAALLTGENTSTSPSRGHGSNGRSRLRGR